MAKNRFRKLVRGQPPAKSVLPSIHTTDVYRFVDALEAEKLIPRPCTVFHGEPLLYFFYGRPSYRVSSDQDATSLIHYLPVCLLFRTPSIHPIKRIFPFDSGGFDRKMYADALHKDMVLDDYGLDPNPDTPGKVISLFFGTVDSYLDAHPVPKVDVAPTEFEAISYHALISQKLSNTRDNRISGIELQLEGELDITGRVEAIVLPGTLLDDPALHSKLASSGIVPLPYRQIDRQRPSEYVSELFDLCYDYYRRTGLIT